MISALETLSIPSQRWLATYWLAKRGERAMPARGDIDAVEMPPKVLPNVSLLEVAEPPRRCRFRLAGTAYNTALGCDPTGKWLDQLPFVRAAAGWKSATEQVVADARPVFQVVRFIRWDGTIFDIHALKLPLSDDGERVTMILGHDVFVKQRALFEHIADEALA